MAMSEPLGSDILTSSNCGPCLNENKNNEATMFCVECNDMLCDICVGTHKRFPTLKTHQIVVQTDKEQFEFTARLLTDKCERHKGKQLETFCKNHDKLCCSVCVSINHRTCEGLVYLPEHANEKTAKDFCKGTIDKTKQIKSKAEELIRRRDAYKITLKQKRERSYTKIDVYRKELIAEIDRIHRDSLADVKSRHDRREEIANEDMEICNYQITELDKVIRTFESETADNVRRFIGTKRAAEVIKHSREKIDDMSEIKDIGSEYILDTTLKAKLVSIKTFEELANEPEVYKFESKEKISDYCDIICQRLMPKETDFCSIQGIVSLENSQIMIADWDNSNIKLLNSNLGVMQTFPLPGMPRAICLIENDICISYKDEGKVDIVTLSSNALKIKQTFNVGKGCRGICYHNNKLFVACRGTDGGEVRVYSKEGQLKHIFDKDAQGKNMFTSPYSVKTNADGSLLFVGDYDKGAIALKMDGTLLWEFNDSKLIRNVWDIAVDENDDLFVCCSVYSSNIVKISADGKKAETFVNGIHFPNAIYYDIAKGKLIIAKSSITNSFNLNTDTLVVYQVLKHRK